MVVARLNEINKIVVQSFLHLKHGITVYRRLVHGNGEKRVFFLVGGSFQWWHYEAAMFIQKHMVPNRKESEVTNSSIVESSNTW